MIAKSAAETSARPLPLACPLLLGVALDFSGFASAGAVISGDFIASLQTAIRPAATGKTAGHGHCLWGMQILEWNATNMTLVK
jgi:hypothetical protein